MMDLVRFCYYCGKQFRPRLSRGGLGGLTIYCYRKCRYKGSAPKISKALMGHPVSQEEREKLSQFMRETGRKPPVQTQFKKGQTPWNKGSKEYGDFMRRYWYAHPEYREKIMRGLAVKPPYRDTKIERKLQRLLTKAGLKYETHYHIGWLSKPDIAFPNLKIAVYADGCYFHDCPACGFGNGRPQDQRIDRTLASQGWLVLRYWGHEINDPEQDKQIVFEIMDAIDLRMKQKKGRWLE